MKNTILIALLVMVSSIASHAQTVKATVRSVTGDAYVKLPGSSTPVALKQGQAIPTGSIITTKAGSQAILSPFPGAGVLIKENSEVSVDSLSYKTSGSVVEKRAANLGLRSGKLNFALDGLNKKVTDFKVHAGGAVAAARGTSGGVAVTGGNAQVVCSGGNIAITFPNGNVTTLTPGLEYQGGGGGVTNASAALLQEAALAVVALVEAGATPESAAQEVIDAFNAAGIPLPDGMTLENLRDIGVQTTLNPSNQTSADKQTILDSTRSAGPNDSNTQPPPETF